MADTLFTNVRIFDGTSRKTRAGEVRVEGNRIAALAKKGERLSRDGAQLVNGEGMTLMPGLVNTHCHPSFTNYADVQELGDLPVEEHAIRAAANAKLLLDSGFTAFVSAAASKPRLDIALRNMIDAGHIPGPRMRATTPELTITGGFADSRRPGADKPAAGICCNGAEEFRRTIRWLIGEGVDIVKFIISGDSFGYPGVSSRIDPITEEELRAICETTLGMGRRLAAHAHTDASVRACIKHGVEFIYHASYCTDATVEALAKVKDKHYVSPAIGVRYFAIHEGERWGLTPEKAQTMGLVAEVEAAKVTIPKLHKAGVKIVPFGDYGIAWTPHGSDCRDLQLMVDLFGMSNWEVLRAATAYGGEAFAGEPMGRIKKGYLADLLLVDGDPLADLRVLEDRDNLAAIMLDGSFHKSPRPRRYAQREAAE